MSSGLVIAWTIVYRQSDNLIFGSRAQFLFVNRPIAHD